MCDQERQWTCRCGEGLVERSSGLTFSGLRFTTEGRQEKVTAAAGEVASLSNLGTLSLLRFVLLEHLQQYVA